MRFVAACRQVVVVACFAMPVVLCANPPAVYAQTLDDLLFGSTTSIPPTSAKPKSKTTKQKKKSAPARARKKSSTRSGLGVGTSVGRVTPIPPTRKNPAVVQIADKRHESENEIVTILAGEPGQTSMRLAHDLTVIVEANSNIRVWPIAGTGGIQNIKDLAVNRLADLAITYADILAEIQSDEGLRETFGASIKPVAKLCNAELHVLAGAKILDIADLEGAVVSYGPDGSAGQFAARRIFANLGVKPIERPLHTRDALTKVKTGELAAAVVLAGKPASHLEGLKRDDGLHLLSVPYMNSMPGHYLPSQITAADYPHLIAGSEGRIDTLAVGKILVARSPENQKAGSKAVGVFVRAFFESLEQLRIPPRHPKWHETTLSASVPGWTRLTVANDILAELKIVGKDGSKANIINRATANAPEEESAKLLAKDPRRDLIQELTKNNPPTERQKP